MFILNLSSWGYSAPPGSSALLGSSSRIDARSSVCCTTWSHNCHRSNMAFDIRISRHNPGHGPLASGDRCHLSAWGCLPLQSFVAGCRLCKYSLLYLFQNAFTKCWERRQYRLQYTSLSCNLPNGGYTSIDFPVSKELGENGSGEYGSPRVSTVRVQPITTASASHIIVRKASSSSLCPCTFNN